MDPNATLKEIRELLAANNKGEEIDVDRLCELIEALDRWLVGGGFLPRVWKH